MTKPGIIRGNLITAIGAFLFASKGEVNVGLFIYAMAGIALVIASACVFNNYIDRDIDRAMERTKQRALAKSSIKPVNALIFGTIIGLAGLIILGVFVNTLTMALGFLAFLVYVILYGFTKRRSEHGTLVGSISGALPITAGYTSVAGKIDEVALILFFILVFWQMPHFYSIAIFRMKEYQAAKLPMLPIKKGILNTKIQITIYLLFFFMAVSWLYIQGHASATYQVIMTLATAFWLGTTIKGFEIKNNKDDKAWAISMFKVSLNVLALFSFVIAIDNFLP
ncbi:protoheme IX farnesyltransferase [Candidatus Saccharibacteria bacterium]|nr:protoheme IX farnesyltransferase [Candidatus Saccharibacteria bacterium]